MLLCALLALAQTPASELIDNLDKLAKAQDVAGLTQYLAPFEGRNPLDPIKTGGAYGVGRYGWHAILLRMLDDNYVVFSTELTSEDIGELLFRLNPNGKLAYIPEDNANGERIASHDFDIHFDLAKKMAIIKDTLELDRIGSQNMFPMVRLGPNYKVSKITNAEGKDVAFLQAGGIVCFPELHPIEKLTFHYTGLVNKPQFAGSITDKEAMLTNDYWYPMIARQPAPYKLTATVPEDWTPVGQGELESESVAGGMKKATFRMDLPVTYYSFSAAPYKTVENTIGGTKFRIWSNELSPDQMAMQNELYAPIIHYYQTIVPFPFSGWGAVVSRSYGGGALEAYSFATYGTGMPGEDAHETAHTWWGGIVDNTYLHSMWNESFADFCEGLYRRNVPIGNVEERRQAFVVTPDVNPAYNVAAVSAASPFIGPAASALGYGKGALVLQMLEQEIGTDKMLKSMREWIRVHPPMQGGEWTDFENAVTRVQGLDMHWFFSEWLDRPGWTDFDVQDLKWDKRKLTGKIVFKSEPYIIHSEVLIRDEDGHDTFVTAPLSDNVRDKEQHFAIPCPTKPGLVSFDPWRRLLRPIHDDEEPVELTRKLNESQRYTDPKHPEYLKGVFSGRIVDKLPSDLDGVFLVGNPETMPELKRLCAKVGFTVEGDKLTWKGTEIDLKKGAALAVVDLGNGKSCTIGMGQTRMRPQFGRAKLVLVDDLGRFLRGETAPKTNGYLTFDKF
ncbi:MAG TPA: M1 family aminopeptidase [Fimbriimonadaceae bacterium]|nr:M1 family aminopeptidase [Fimbriimonadaceae bacterium]